MTSTSAPWDDVDARAIKLRATLRQVFALSSVGALDRLTAIANGFHDATYTIRGRRVDHLHMTYP